MITLLDRLHLKHQCLVEYIVHCFSSLVQAKAEHAAEFDMFKRLLLQASGQGKATTGNANGSEAGGKPAVLGLFQSADDSEGDE